MTERDQGRFTRLVLSTCTLLAVSACGTTVDDTASIDPTATTVDVDANVPAGAEPAIEDGELIEGGVIVDSGPEPTLPIAGSPAELLPELAIEMSRLSALIVDGGDRDGSLARIEAIWAQIRDDIAASRPELVNGIGASVDMARTAVERTRPADADKAFSLLTELVDEFVGDG